MPWRDRSGAFSPLKALVLAALFLPALSLAADAWSGALGPKRGRRPITIRGCGRSGC